MNEKVSEFECTPVDVQAQLRSTRKPFLIDVREPQEFAIARLEDAELIPLQSVPAELQRLEGMADERDLVVICHHGVRSLQVVAWLRAQGIQNCVSMTGGMDRWSLEIDPTVPRY
jgi:rhodanese-related sulfurtransferase